MKFRVWDKKNNRYSKGLFLLDGEGSLWELSVDFGVSCCPVTDRENYEVEVSTGVTLADGADTFYGDIVSYKTEVFECGKIVVKDAYFVLTKDNLHGLEGDINRNDWSFYRGVKIVGNIHETELSNN